MTSAAIVPNTATIDTAVHYGQVEYRGVRDCHQIATTKTRKPRSTPRYLFTSSTTKSDIASPIAVVSSFTTQKYGFTAGTFTGPANAVPVPPDTGPPGPEPADVDPRGA